MSEDDKIIKGPYVPSLFSYNYLGKVFFESIKKRSPDKIIVIDGETGEQISYGRIFETSIVIAQKLKNLGIKKGDVIAIILKNNWKYIAAGLACFFLAAPSFILNHDYLMKELAHFFDIGKPQLVLCITKTEKNILAMKYTGAIINLDEGNLFDESRCYTLGHSFEPTESDSQDVAVILTSSGTTGIPKGVMLTHENILNLLQWAGDPAGLNLNNVKSTVAYLPCFHLFGFALDFAAILCETQLIMMESFHPEKFLKAIHEHQTTSLMVVPPILQFFLKTSLLDRYNTSSIADVFCAAAKCTKELSDMIEKLLKVEVRQGYGLTETGGVVTAISKNVRKPGSVGPLTMNFAGKVCEPETGKILGPNQTGELRFKGKGIMKGYLNDEEHTKLTFDENGYLKTGDLGYYDEDHFFYIVDRLKDIIKYKGFQVSPAELETLLIQHPLVKDAGVVGVPDDRAGEVPLAFVVREGNVTEKELIKYVDENISIQKRLYGGVRFVDEIPRTASGKILRKNLKKLF